MTSAPVWEAAKAEAVATAFARCRPSATPWRRVHVGDWFQRSALVRTDALPSAIKAGFSTRYSPELRRTVRYRTIDDMRLPMPEFWHPAWQPIIAQAINDSSGP